MGLSRQTVKVIGKGCTSYRVEASVWGNQPELKTIVIKLTQIDLPNW